nr:cation:proton antiporter [Bacillus subtilis]
MDHLVFEVGTALVLVAIASVIANKIKFSIIPFLIVLGMLVGPHALKMGIIDLTFIQSSEIIEFFGRMGVLFLLFYLGLEFSVGKLIKSGKSIAVGGTIYILINFSLGLLYGFITGFSFLEVLILAGVITISSSAIVAKVLVDLKRTANPETELILGIIMFEDIFLAVYLSVVSGLVLGDATSVGSAFLSILIAFGYILLFFIATKKTPAAFKQTVGHSLKRSVYYRHFRGRLFFIAGFSETIHVAEAIGALAARFGLFRNRAFR